MRRHRVNQEKLKVCREYERLRKRWQRLVDGTIAPSETQPIDEDATAIAKQKMVEHRENCEACKKEDLALKEGEVPTPASAGI
jgi:hypothetical protein